MAAVTDRCSVLNNDACDMTPGLANSKPGGSPPGAAAKLISACRASATPIKCLRGRSGPKTRSRTTDCSVIRVAQSRVPQHRLTRDNCCYRESNLSTPFSISTEIGSRSAISRSQPWLKPMSLGDTFARRIFEASHPRAAMRRMAEWPASTRVRCGRAQAIPRPGHYGRRSRPCNRASCAAPLRRASRRSP